MLSKDKVSLCLKIFDTNTKKYWQDFQIEHDFYDLTLACGDKHIKAHKIVIAAHSIVLKNILRLYPNQSQLIYLRGIDYSDLENIVNFMYRGEIEIDKDDLEGFLGVAEELKIKGIIDFNGQSTALSLQSANPIEKNTKTVDVDSFQEYLKQEDTSEDLNELDMLKLLDLPSISFALCNKDQTEIEKDFMEIKEDKPEAEGKNIPEPRFQDYDKDTLLSCDLTGNGTELFKNNGTVSFQELLFITKSKESEGKLVTDIPKSFNSLSKNEAPVFMENDNPLSIGDGYDKFGKNSDLKERIQLFHEMVEYDCNQCDYKGKGKMFLKDHIRIKHTNDYYPCDQCTYKGTTIPMMNDHSARVHVPYKCEKCDVTVLGRRRLKRHMEKHKGIIYQCNKCGSTAKTNDDHKRHLKVIHGDARFMCDQCEFKTKTSSNLKQHMESIHLGIPYPCEQCGYQAQEKRILRKHLEKWHLNNAKSTPVQNKI